MTTLSSAEIFFWSSNTKRQGRSFWTLNVFTKLAKYIDPAAFPYLRVTVLICLLMYRRLFTVDNNSGYMRLDSRTSFHTRVVGVKEMNSLVNVVVTLYVSLLCLLDACSCDLQNAFGTLLVVDL